MKTAIAALLPIVFFIYSPSGADSTGYTFAGELMKFSGQTSYTMEIAGFDTAGNYVQAKSYLEFPLDGFLLGLEAGYQAVSLNKVNWSLQFGLYRNINNPSGFFIDRDWYTGETEVGYFDGKFSDTQSDVKINHLLMNLSFRKRLFGTYKYCLYFSSSIRYQRISFDAVNIKGRQINIWEDPTFTSIYVDTSIYAMYYRITYTSPILGMQFDYYPSEWATLILNTSYMAAYGSDYDDHVLRNRLATASGLGNGFVSSAKFRFRPISYGPLYFDISAQYLTLKTSPKQTIKWYGDDPLTDGDDTGLQIKNIPHVIKSTQYNFRFVMGIMF